MAEMLFMIPDVHRVFFGNDYISVTRGEDAQWKHLKPAVLGAIMDFYVAGGTKELIELRVRPAVAQDGGDIVFKHFDDVDGIVFLEMRGACAGCPSSTMTLKHGIENLLKHYVTVWRFVQVRAVLPDCVSRSLLPRVSPCHGPYPLSVLMRWKSRRAH